jgi:hypothetical protein
VIRRCLLVLSALLLFALNANCGPAYQRTKDGQTFIWNNFPRPGDAATWSGHNDANGYATGYGTLTWYKSDRKVVTGSNIPASTKGNIVFGRYTGQMIHGKFQGLVINTDANGQTFHGTFINGRKTGDWTPGSAPNRTAVLNQSPRKNKTTEPAPPAAGPPPVERRSAKSSASTEPSHEQSLAEKEAAQSTAVDSLQAVMTPPSTLRAPMVAAIAPHAPAAAATPAQSPGNSVSVEPTVRNRIVADFREETESVLSRVSDATGNFRETDRLDSVQQLPTPVSESVDALMDRARDFRAKLGYETALREYRVETQTADALGVVDQMTHNFAAGDASLAANRVNEFLKDNPGPPGEHPSEGRRNLWRYLDSMRSLCGRSEKEAGVHLQQAQLFAAAGKMSEALREYQEAQRLFPTPSTAQKIHQLQENSLGL